MTVRDISALWAAGRSCVSRGALDVDNKGRLWSYNLQIGERRPHGKGYTLVVWDYTGDAAISHTTSVHVTLAVTAAVNAHITNGVSYSVLPVPYREVALARSLPGVGDPRS